jgi:hypothetical protein
VCAPCHGKTAEPSMGNCGDCHQSGEKAASKRKISKWSVAKAFDHSTHGRDPRKSGETQCTVCHANVAKATKLDRLMYPRMKDCDSCHDGKHAFKTTGFRCYECHGAKAK